MSVEVKREDDPEVIPPLALSELDMFGTLVVKSKDSTGQFHLQLRTRQITDEEEILIISVIRGHQWWISEFDYQKLTKTGMFGMCIKDYKRVIERLFHMDGEAIDIFPIDLPMGVKSHSLDKFELMKFKSPIKTVDDSSPMISIHNSSLMICMKDLLLTGVTSDPSRTIEHRLIVDPYTQETSEIAKIRLDFEHKLQRLKSEFMSQIEALRDEVDSLKKGYIERPISIPLLPSAPSSIDDQSIVTDDLSPRIVSGFDGEMFTLELSSHHPCSENTLAALNSKDIRCGAGTNMQRDPWIAIRFAWGLRVRSISVAPMAYGAPGSWGPKYLNGARLMVLLPQNKREIELKTISCSDLNIKRFTINKVIREVILRKLDITDFLGIGHFSIEIE